MYLILKVQYPLVLNDMFYLNFGFRIVIIKFFYLLYFFAVWILLHVE